METGEEDISKKIKPVKFSWEERFLRLLDVSEILTSAALHPDHRL